MAVTFVGINPRHQPVASRSACMAVDRLFGEAVDGLGEAVGERGLGGGEAGGVDGDAGVGQAGEAAEFVGVVPDEAEDAADLLDEAGARGAAAAVFEGGEVGRRDVEAGGEIGQRHAALVAQSRAGDFRRASSDTAEEDPDGALVGGVRVRGGEDDGAQRRVVEPERDLAAEYAAGFAAAAAGDDLDAAEALGHGGAEEGVQIGVGALDGAAVEVERALRGELAAAEARPGAAVDAAGGGADLDAGPRFAA